MDLWLSRFRNGDFGLSAFPPKRCKMIGSNTQEWFFRYGDPVGHRHMCPTVTAKLFGDRVLTLKSSDHPIRVRLKGSIVE